MNVLTTYPFFGHLVIASSLVLTAGFALYFLLGSRSAAARELIWRSVFLVLFLLPLTWLFRPFGLLTEAATLAPAFAGFPADRVSAGFLPGREFMEATPPLPWDLIGGGIYATGMVLLLLRTAAGVIWQRRWKAGAMPCTDRTALQLWQEIDRAEIGTLLVSPACRMPLTWGKIVLLPHEALQWRRGDLAAALQHEAAHMERRDWCYRQFGEIAAAVFWPHPLMWLARRLWHRTQEQSCDDAVLRAGTDPANYAQLLCSAARSWTRPASAVMSMAQPSSLELRLRAMLDSDCARGPCAPVWKNAAKFAILLAFTATALGQKKDKAEPPPEAGPVAPAFEKSPGIRKSSKAPDPFSTKIASTQAAINSLRKTHSSLERSNLDELIEAFSKLDTGNVTIKSFSRQYKLDQNEIVRMMKSGFGPSHPRIIGLKKSLEETRKILLSAAKNYQESLAVTIRNLEQELMELGKAAN